MDLATRFYPYLPYVVAAIVLLAVGVAIYLLIVLQKARKREPLHLAIEPDAAAPKPEAGKKDDLWARLAQARALRRSIVHAMKFLRENTAGRDVRYQIPWFMLMGESKSGKTTLLESAGLRASLLERAEDFGVHQAIQWRFFSPGVVLDVYGDYVLRSDGLTADEAGWDALLKQLRNSRARRPLDGIVIALPCRDFMPPRSRDLEAIEAKAARLCDRLWRAEKILGFALPVYVLVTQSDTLRGFREFCRQIPLRNRQDIFGWSSPYSLMAAFKPAWIGEAFDSMGRDLSRLQCEIFTERGNLPNADEVFLFPGEFDALRVPLSTFLGRMFKETAYRESFYFRGLYFTGDPEWEEIPPAPPFMLTEEAPDPFAEPAPAPSAAPSRPAAPCRPNFLRRLFEEKIFPEAAVARPVPMVYRSKSRLEWASQLTALILALILAWGVTDGYFRITEMWHKLKPTLEGISREMSPTAPPLMSGQSVCDLTQSMGELNMNVFSTWFFPTSIVSPLNARVKRAMEPAFRFEVLDALRRLLDKKAEQVLAMPAPPPSTTLPAPAPSLTEASQVAASYSPESTEQFQALQSFTAQLASLQANVHRYDLLSSRGTGGSAELNGLMAYLGLKCALPSNYAENPYFQTAIAEVSGNHFNQGHVKGARDKIEQLMRNYFDVWLNQNPVAVNVTTLESQIGGLENEPTPSYQDLQDLDARISLVKALLASPAFNWLSSTTLKVSDPFYQAAMDAAGRTRFFRASIERGVKRMADSDFQNLRGQLETAQTDLTGNLLQPAGNGFQLSDGTNTLQLDLENLMNLPFMAATPQASAGIPVSGEPILWEVGPLQVALSQYDAYESYVKEGLRSSSPAVEATLRRVATRRLQSNMDGLIARAETIAQPSQPSSRAGSNLAELESFEAAEAPLSEILAAFQKLGFYSSYASLEKLTTLEAAALLARLGKKLNAQEPYVEKSGNFFWWRGEPNPAFEAFDVPTAAGLDGYLAFERQRLASWAREAKPLVNFLSARTSSLSATQRQTYEQWRQISVAIGEYDRKVPGNSVSRLEDFIRVDMNKYNPAQDCQVGPVGGAQTGASDFFIERRNALRRAIEAQCKYLADWSSYRDYSSMAQQFNRSLAGRFPFATHPSMEPSAEADPAAILAFYQRFDAQQAFIRLVLTGSSNFGPTRQPALSFLDRMKELRPLFSSLLLAGQQPPVMALDFIPEFRVNRRAEVGGNQIIGWTLRVGDETFRAHQPARTGRWEVGKPVSLSLRWAKDSSVTPIPAKSEPRLRVEGRVAIFRYTDPWSLLALLARHHAPPTAFPALLDPHPFTLLFKLATETTAIAGSTISPPVPKETRVFIRISVMPPGKKESLTLPAFPIKAPTLIWETP